MNKEQILAIIQGGHTTDGDLADALLAELAKGAKHIRTAFLNKDGGVTLLMSRSDPSTHSEFKKYLYTSPLPQPDLVAEIERLGNELKRWPPIVDAWHNTCEELRQQLATAQQAMDAAYNTGYADGYRACFEE